MAKSTCASGGSREVLIVFKLHSRNAGMIEVPSYYEQDFVAVLCFKAIGSGA